MYYSALISQTIIIYSKEWRTKNWKRLNLSAGADDESDFCAIQFTPWSRLLIKLPANVPERTLSFYYRSHSSYRWVKFNMQCLSVSRLALSSGAVYLWLKMSKNYGCVEGRHRVINSLTCIWSSGWVLWTLAGYWKYFLFNVFEHS